MKRRTLLYGINIAAIVLTLSGMLPPAAVATTVQAAAGSQAAEPVAPSTQADNWPAPKSILPKPAAPVANPADMALEKATGGLIEAELLGQGMARMEPLSSGRSLNVLTHVARPAAPEQLPQSAHVILDKQPIAHIQAVAVNG